MSVGRTPAECWQAAEAALGSGGVYAEEGRVSMERYAALRSALRQLCETAPAYALHKDAPAQLWNACLKPALDAARPKARSSPTFRLLLGDAHATLKQLAIRLARHHRCRLPNLRGLTSRPLWLPDGGLRVPDASEDQLRALFGFCLLHLGDVARYQRQLPAARLFYRQALETDPKGGQAQAWNQLAILASQQDGDCRLEVLALYLRATAVQGMPFDPAAGNASALLKEEMKKVSADGPPECLRSRLLLVVAAAHFAETGPLKAARAHLPGLQRLLREDTEPPELSETEHVSLAVVVLATAHRVSPGWFGEEEVELAAGEGGLGLLMTQDERSAHELLRKVLLWHFRLALRSFAAAPHDPVPAKALSVLATAIAGLPERSKAQLFGAHLGAIWNGWLKLALQCLGKLRATSDEALSSAGLRERLGDLQVLGHLRKDSLMDPLPSGPWARIPELAGLRFAPLEEHWELRGMAPAEDPADFAALKFLEEPLRAADDGGAQRAGWTKAQSAIQELGARRCLWLQAQLEKVVLSGLGRLVPDLAMRLDRERLTEAEHVEEVLQFAQGDWQTPEPLDQDSLSARDLQSHFAPPTEPKAGVDSSGDGIGFGEEAADNFPQKKPKHPTVAEGTFDRPSDLSLTPRSHKPKSPPLRPPVQAAAEVMKEPQRAEEKKAKVPGGGVLKVRLPSAAEAEAQCKADTEQQSRMNRSDLWARPPQGSAFNPSRLKAALGGGEPRGPPSGPTPLIPPFLGPVTSHSPVAFPGLATPASQAFAQPSPPPPLFSPTLGLALPPQPGPAQAAYAGGPSPTGVTTPDEAAAGPWAFPKTPGNNVRPPGPGFPPPRFPQPPLPAGFVPLGPPVGMAFPPPPSALPQPRFLDTTRPPPRNGAFRPRPPFHSHTPSPTLPQHSHSPQPHYPAWSQAPE